MGRMMNDCNYPVFRGSSVGQMMKECNYPVFRGSSVGRMMKAYLDFYLRD